MAAFFFFFFKLFMLSAVLWIIFLFVLVLLALIVSKIVGASVKCQFGGWNCLRDIVVKLKKGAAESITVGEIRVGFGIISKDPKLLFFISGLELVMRPSTKSKSPKKAKTRKHSSSSKGKKLMSVAKIARFFSLSVKDIIVKTPKATVKVVVVKLNMLRDGGSKPSLFLKLQISPVLVIMETPHASFDQSSSLENIDNISTNQLNPVLLPSTPFSCEDFSLSCEFSNDREAGPIVHSLDINLGDISMTINEQLLSKKKKSTDSTSQADTRSLVDPTSAAEPKKKQSPISAISKYTPMIPEKICFNIPKLGMRVVHEEQNLCLENTIVGIQLKTLKSTSTEDTGQSTRLDVQLDFKEIHLLREADTSILHIEKVDVVLFLYVPLEPSSPIKAEVDIKLGGTRCDIMMGKLKPWLHVLSSRKKPTRTQVESIAVEKPQPVSHLTEPKSIKWTCTFSVPEMTLVLYNLGGTPIYNACSQSSHVFANNLLSVGTTVHAEHGPLNLYLMDEVESNPGSLFHIKKISLDWGKKDMETRSDDEASRYKLVLSVDIFGMGLYFTVKRVESLIATAMSFKAFFKSLKPSNKTGAQVQSPKVAKGSGKGARLLKFNLQDCSINFCGQTCLENTVVTDPKRVNYGNQGGRVVISVSDDGTPRTATIMSTTSDEYQKLGYSVSLDIVHFNLCVNKEKQSTQVELERARSIYQENREIDKYGTKVVLFEMQNAKFVQRSGGHKDRATYSLFSSTSITFRWEPDAHIALFELGLQLKLIVQNQKLQGLDNKQEEGISSAKDVEQEKKATVVDSSNVATNKRKESIFAVDVEMLSVSSEAGDGVEAIIQVQSIFSENARIGVLFEGLTVGFNGALIFKSSRMQISRIPRVSTSSSDVKLPSSTWDLVVQALDIYICMPFRLELRAIDDAVEEMLRALKLVTTSKTNLLFPMKKESSKPKKSNPTKLGCVRFCIRKVTFDIEEEPMQGWLDEHYQLMKNEAWELAVRLKFLDDIIAASECPKTDESNDSTSEKKFQYNEVEVDMLDTSAIHKMREEIYRQSFRSYYAACQKLKPSEGSGACKEGFQAGFRASTARTSVFAAIATDFDVTLTKIDGGEEGMIEVVKKLDPVCEENNIPFSRLYGSNILLKTGTLSVLLRDYSFPLFAATSGRSQGCLVMAQQATVFQPQMRHDVFIGRWRKVSMLRSVSGTTPPMKTYSDLPLHFQKGELSFGVGYEPVFADVSYAFTVALRRANLSLKGPGVPVPPKKEKSLPWWDDMRNYIHGNITLYFSETEIYLLATTDPYEKLDKLKLVTGYMEIQQSDGRVYVSAEHFKIFISSLESMASKRNLEVPTGYAHVPFLETPLFTLEVKMDWGCDSGYPLNHYLFALPIEGKLRDKVFDPFRSTSLSFQWNISLRTLPSDTGKEPPSTSMTDKAKNTSVVSPTVTLGAHDMAWLNKFCKILILPPHKLRLFSRFPRFGVPRIARSGNLSLDRVLTEFMVRMDITPMFIKNMPMEADDQAKGLIFSIKKFKLEMCLYRGKQKYTFECTRDPLDLVYQGVDIHMLNIFFDKENCLTVTKLLQMSGKHSKSAPLEGIPCEKLEPTSGCIQKPHSNGFLLSSDYFTIRKQAPKADPVMLSSWQEAGKKNAEIIQAKSEVENEGEHDEHTQSDGSDDEGYNVIVADNCQRVFVFGLKLLWSINNRDAVMSLVGGLSKAFASNPSPSRQYAQRKLLEEKKKHCTSEIPQEDATKSPTSPGMDSSLPQAEMTAASNSPKDPVKMENPSIPELEPENENIDNPEEEGTLHFMVNVIEPQFNLQSEEANGRFLLAAGTGRVLARSFHSVLHVGSQMIEQALGNENSQMPEFVPEMTWKRMEVSVMLEHVQAHVAPTDVDLEAGVQWLPKIRKNSRKVKRTGALLERVFMPCDMYFRYTRHKGGTPELKVKPLKELTFNSHDINATMTSRQFQVIMDVLSNLLFARAAKPRKSSLSYPGEDDEDTEEEADQIVPDGVEEVELAKIDLEQKEWGKRLLLQDIWKLSLHCDLAGECLPEKEDELWMISSGRSILVHELKRELVNAQKLRKDASASLREVMQKAAQARIIEKEKNRSPSCAMRVSVQINKVAWSMLLDGKSFSEVEISDMIYDFDRDYKDVGLAKFTMKCFVIKNCLPNAKCDTLLAAWNPPTDWGKKVMIRVDAKQGVPKDGNSVLELLLVEIYPLKIHLTEAMYRMIWSYLFPEEEQDSQQRQEVWKVSTTGGGRRGRKNSIDASAPSGHVRKDSISDSTQAPKAQNSKGNSTPKLRRTSSFDRTWEETVAESVANELVLQAQSSGAQDESSKGKPKDTKAVKSGPDKKAVKSQDDKKARPRRLREFHSIKISQVELLVTYEGVVSDVRLLMDSFHLDNYTGTWGRLFSRVKKHVIWGVLKSVTGMQGKKFKDTRQAQPSLTGPTTEDEFDLGDNEQGGKADRLWLKQPSDGAGDGFVTSMKGLFSTQKKKAKHFVLRTMRGEEDELRGAGSEGEQDFSPFARQLTITKAKKLIKRHTKKYRSKEKRGSSKSPKADAPPESDSSSGSSHDGNGSGKA